MIRLLNKIYKKIIFCAVLFVFFMCFFALDSYAANLTPLPGVDITVDTTDDPQGVVSSLQVVFILVLLSFAPTILLVMTSFTRIIISLHFLRSALGTQQMPPNQILLTLALFLTFFQMGPIFSEINDRAIVPYSEGRLSQGEAFEQGMIPLRQFMDSQVEDKDVALFVNLSGLSFASAEEIPNRIIIPAFILGELTKGFKIGFIVYLPFLVIDMVVASVLMAMGMMMLPPAMISLPFKVLLFVMVDGWSLILESIMRTF